MPVASLWHKDFPLKVMLFVWRLFRDRPPTKDNQYRHQVIDIEAQSRVGGCGEVETSSHLFSHCNMFGTIFSGGLVYLWFCVVMHPLFLINQFSFLEGAGKSRRSILQVIWFATV